jgi:hypothetical protein
LIFTAQTLEFDAKYFTGFGHFPLILRCTGHRREMPCGRLENPAQLGSDLASDGSPDRAAAAVYQLPDSLVEFLFVTGVQDLGRECHFFLLV